MRIAGQRHPVHAEDRLYEAAAVSAPRRHAAPLVRRTLEPLHRRLRDCIGRGGEVLLHLGQRNHLAIHDLLVEIHPRIQRQCAQAVPLAARDHAHRHSRHVGQREVFAGAGHHRRLVHQAHEVAVVHPPFVGVGAAYAMPVVAARFEHVHGMPCELLRHLRRRHTRLGEHRSDRTAHEGVADDGTGHAQYSHLRVMSRPNCCGVGTKLRAFTLLLHCSTLVGGSRPTEAESRSLKRYSSRAPIEFTSG